MMDINEVQQLIGQDENQTLEYHAILPASKLLARWICAFANTNGGYIILGITDNKEINGLSPDFKPPAPQTEEALNHLSPKIKDIVYQFITYQNKRLFVVKIEKSQEKIYLDNKVYIREISGKIIEEKHPPKIIFVEGKTDKKIFEKAISLFSSKLDGVEIQTETVYGAGTNWVKDSLISFVINPDKNKGKAIVLVDNDESGVKIHDEIVKHPDYEKENRKQNVKSYVIGNKIKPNYIKLFFQKRVLHSKSDYGIELEKFFPLKYWTYAQSQNWLEDANIAKYKMEYPYTQSALDFALEKGIREEELIFIFSKFKNDCKDKFADYMCSLEEEEQLEAFAEFKPILKEIEKFFEK